MIKDEWNGQIRKEKEKPKNGKDIERELEKMKMQTASLRWRYGIMRRVVE